MKPLIIYSMQKVGSSTVMNAIKSIGIPVHRCYNENIADYHYRLAPTISMIRDPISWVIAIEFERCLIQEKPFPDVVGFVNRTMEKNSPIYATTWFQEYYRQVTGVNVFGTPRYVRKKRGWGIRGERSLLIRTSRLSDQLKPALEQFLPLHYPETDISQVVVEHRAKGSERYGDYYLRFTNEIRFPREYLVSVYNTKFCRSFFLDKELLHWMWKWSKE